MSGRFVLEIAEVPETELVVSSDDVTYRYESTHFYEEGPVSTRLSFPLKELTALPEVLALLSPPPMGCQEVIEERTGALETLCVRRVDPPVVEGTLGSEAFVAKYSAASRLVEIRIASATWKAVARASAAPRRSGFSFGVSVPRGLLRLNEPWPGARWLVEPPRGLRAPPHLADARCLVVARNALEGHPTRRLAVGVVIERGRAFPHAWVVDGTLDLDPSIAPDDPLLPARQYLEIPRVDSGAFFLKLFDGQVRLVSRETRQDMTKRRYPH